VSRRRTVCLVTGRRGHAGRVPKRRFNIGFKHDDNIIKKNCMYKCLKHVVAGIYYVYIIESRFFLILCRLLYPVEQSANEIDVYNML